MQASRLPRSPSVRLARGVVSRHALRVGALALLLGLVAFVSAPAAQAATQSARSSQSQSQSDQVGPAGHLVTPGHAVQRNAVAHRLDSTDVTFAAATAITTPTAYRTGAIASETNSSTTGDTARGRGPPVEA